MSSSYYDVIALGSQLGPLAAASLLAKRGFRVLVLSQEALPPTYVINGHELFREPFNFQYAFTPIAQKIFGELGIRQEIRQKTEVHPDGIQLCLPKQRFVLSKDPDTFSKEIAREFPKVQTPIIDFARRTEALCQELEAHLQTGLPWPPHDPKRLLAFLYHSHALARFHPSAMTDLMGEFSKDQPFVTAMRALESHFVPSGNHSSLQLARVFDLSRHTIAFRGGLKALNDMLFARIRAHGGEIWESERAASVITNGNHATGIRLHNSGQSISAGTIIAGNSLGSVLQMVDDRRPFQKLLERTGEPRLQLARYTLNLVVPRTHLPSALGRDTLVIHAPDQPLFDGSLLHIQRMETRSTGTLERDAESSRAQATNDSSAESQPSHEVLCLQTTLGLRTLNENKTLLRALRPLLIKSAERVLPFLNDYILLADSPHDGLDPEDRRAGTTIPPREPWNRGPHTMPLGWSFPVRPALSLSAIPIRTPYRNLLVCNSQNVPGLADEGSLMAAWSTAELVCKADTRRSWLRRGRWYSQTYAD